MKAEPLMRAVDEIRTRDAVVLLSPQGRTFNQGEAERLASLGHVVLLCGRYEGMDERFGTSSPPRKSRSVTTC